MAKPIVVSAAIEAAHNLPWDKKLAGHRVVVEGLYLAKPKFRDSEGPAKPYKVKYREEFILDPSEHRVYGQGALGHILSDQLLIKRLSEKDPENFRAVSTHMIVEHENLFEQPHK